MESQKTRNEAGTKSYEKPMSLAYLSSKTGLNVIYKQTVLSWNHKDNKPGQKYADNTTPRLSFSSNWF